MANNGLFLAFIGVIVLESTCQSHVVPRPPEEVRVSDISNTSLQLSWTPITDEPERILFYVIRYKPKESDEAYKEEIGNMAETQRVRDLKPGTEYEFSVIGHNSKARGIPSVPIFAKTLDGTDAPDVPADVRILDVTDTTVQLSWSPPHTGSGSISYYNIMYRPKASNQNYSVITGISTYVYTIENLIPYTIYEFSVVAVNSIGSGAPSSPVIAELYGADPATPPVNIQARPLSSTSAVIQWDPPKELIGKILAYQVYFSKHLNSPISEWNMQRVGNNHLTTITGLTSRTVYAVIVQAFSNRGQGPYSSPVQVKTQRGVPTQPSRIVVTEISRSEVSLYWSDPSRAGEEIMNYELYWEDNYTNEFFHESLNNTDTYKITGLHPDTIYSVWVAAKNVYGEGAPTPPIQVKTEEFSPSRPKKVSAKAISSTAIKVKWKRPSKTLQKGLIEGYRIYVEEHHNQQNTGSALKMFYVEDEDTKEFNVTGLQPDTYYSIQVAATTRKGDGALSEQVSVITTGGVPTKPELRVRLTDDKPHFVADASWHPPVYIHGNLRSYRMIHGRTDILEKEQMEVQILDPSTERLTIHNLDYGAHYAFYLSGKNDFGWGKETVVHLKTPEAAPNAPPQNVTFRLQSPTAFVVSWLPPSLQDRNGKIVQYSVQLHNVPEKTTSKRTTADTKMLFTDLSEDTEYVIQVRASTWKGSSSSSNSLSVFTPRFVLPAPIDVSAFATSDKTVEVSWNSAPYLYNALGFRVLYTTESVEDLDQWDYKSVPFTESAELTGLETNATYAIMVAAETNNGLGRLSDVLLVRVEATDVPTELIAKDITTDSMSLSWEKPSKLNPIKYQISYTAYKEFYNSNGELEKLRVPSYTEYLDAHVYPEAHVTEYALLDLMPFTSYHVNVTAITFDKFPRPPAKIIATTAISVPKMVEKPGIYGFGGEITVTLPKASEEYGPISHYYVAVVPAIYATRDPEEYSTGELGAVPLDKIGPYIAAKFTYISMPSEFPLGDGKFYEGYFNRELKRDEEYRIFVRAVVDSPLKNLYSSSPFSDVISWDLSGELEHLTYINEKPEVCKSSGNKRTDWAWIAFSASILLFKMNDS